MIYRSLKRTLFAMGLVSLVAAGCGLAAKESTPAVANESAATATVATPAANITAPAALPNFSAIVAQSGPAVVNISVSGVVKTNLSQFSQFDPNNPFFDFFRHFNVPVPEGNTPVHGVGSGFIVNPDGVILTNAHVVANAQEVTVKLTDKREFKAKVIGIDKPTDIAVLKIDAHDLPTVKLGDSANTKVGDWVLAIGSPFGFENTATAGIVSAKSRSLPDEGYVPFIQTDVAVNPGNSGGPLFNLNGQVIGINAQIYSNSGGYQGLSFAIPIDVAMNTEKQILDHGKVNRGRLGVTIQEVNQSLADAFGLKKPMGALVSSVEPDSPAGKAGLKAGDVILKLNGKEVEESNRLPSQVANIKPGDRATLTIWRDHTERDITVKVGAMNDNTVASANDSDHSKGRLGLAVRPLTPQERREADVHGGLLVEGADGPAARAGIEPGDIIISLNGQPVSKVEQLRKLLDKSGKHVALLVQRHDAKIFVPVDLG